MHFQLPPPEAMMAEIKEEEYPLAGTMAGGLPIAYGQEDVKGLPSLRLLVEHIPGVPSFSEPRRTSEPCTPEASYGSASPSSSTPGTPTLHHAPGPHRRRSANRRLSQVLGHISHAEPYPRVDGRKEVKNSSERDSRAGHTKALARMQEALLLLNPDMRLASDHYKGWTTLKSNNANHGLIWTKINILNSGIETILGVRELLDNMITYLNASDRFEDRKYADYLTASKRTLGLRKQR